MLPLSRRAPAVSDQLLVRREIYNPNQFPITWLRQNDKVPYILNCGITAGPAAVHCAPGGRCILPHMYYIPKTPLEDGAPLNVLQVFGDAIGTGETKPSRPNGM